MAPGTDVTSVQYHGNSVVVDVTTLIGAEEFILAQNSRRPLDDPFGRQCFVEIVQSLIFMSEVFVAHPTLAVPRDADFGQRPRLLQALLSRRLITPLHLDRSAWRSAVEAESTALGHLQSADGIDSVVRFARHALICDEESSREDSLSNRIRAWSEFQEARVRGIPSHHEARIPTQDGIEEDAFGDWARAAAIVLRETLADFSAPDAASYLMATLARSVRYRARAGAVNLSYQSHPMRRDFLLTFELSRGGAESSFILDVIKVVRGIHTSLRAAAGEPLAPRLQILELELPLLGGRLWESSDVGQRPNADWVEYVADGIAEYRSRARELRVAIENCVTSEDYLRLVRDIMTVRQRLIERLGFRSVELSPVERELVDSVASVSESIPGIPKVSGLWVGFRNLEKRYLFSGEPYQRFLYKEFVKA